MVGGDLNFDSLGLQHHVGDAATISQIYSRHPEWASPPRKKLTFLFDCKNCDSWKGDTRVNDVDKAACWDHGLNEVLCCICESRIFIDDELSVNKIQKLGSLITGIHLGLIHCYSIAPLFHFIYIFVIHHSRGR